MHLYILVHSLDPVCFGQHAMSRGTEKETSAIEHLRLFQACPLYIRPAGRPGTFQETGILKRSKANPNAVPHHHLPPPPPLLDPVPLLDRSRG
jgi:hypothetical protein